MSIRTGSAARLLALALLASVASAEAASQEESASPNAETAASRGRPSPFSLSLSIINDNKPFVYVKDDGGLGFTFGRGPDNAFTTGLRADTLWDSRILFADRLRLFVFLNMYTSMDRAKLYLGGWRTDFLSSMLWGESELWSCSGRASVKATVGYGLGAIGRGDFLGAAIQNGAHALFGDPGYDLEYLSGGYSAGPLAGASARLEVSGPRLGGYSFEPFCELAAIYDILGVARSQAALTGGLRVGTGSARAGLEAGYRLSRDGNDDRIAELFSSRAFASAYLDLDVPGGTFRLGYSLNPYGNAPTPESVFWDTQNQQFSWTYTAGRGENAFAGWLFLP